MMGGNRQEGFDVRAPAQQRPTGAACGQADYVAGITVGAAWGQADYVAGLPVI